VNFCNFRIISALLHHRGILSETNLQREMVLLLRGAKLWYIVLVRNLSARYYRVAAKEWYIQSKELMRSID